MFKLKKKFAKQDGQGLLELIIAIGVISVGILSVWNFYMSNYFGEQDARRKIVATNLAREGVEVVKNIRDSNWLYMLEDNTRTWDTGINNLAFSSSTVDQDFPNLPNPLINSGLVPLSGVLIEQREQARIYLKDNLYVNHSTIGSPLSASTTPYSRIIRLKNICCADLDNNLVCDDAAMTESDNLSCPGALKIGIDVASQVSWLDDRGKIKNITVEEQLFNWK